MKHYKDTNNNIFAYESDGSQDAYIKDGLMPISDTDLAILRAPTPTEIAAAASNTAKAAIAGINTQSIGLILTYLASQTGAGLGSIKALESLAVAERAKL